MFLIVDVPDLSKTPYVRYVGANVNPAIPALASQFTGDFDAGLEGAAGSLAGLPGMQYFRFFDVNALFDQVIASPGAFHLSDVTDRCTTPDVQGHAICAEANQYLFWDGTHPTTAGHSAVAMAAFSLLPPQ
jgi:outer membrane lipase/esterase